MRLPIHRATTLEEALALPPFRERARSLDEAAEIAVEICADVRVR